MKAEERMASVWKKTMQYLGLVEDEDLEDLDEGADELGVQSEVAPVRRINRGETRTIDRPETIVRTMPSSRVPAMASIHRAEPRRFNDARDIGERYKQGVPVIMNLQSTEDPIARRLVDFASGLVFGLDGKIEMVASRVYLLTPANMEVSAEERERLVEGGFFNQF
jgi:cell division inhibitor SepF